MSSLKGTRAMCRGSMGPGLRVLRDRTAKGHGRMFDRDQS
jgi:hypothetical protein